MRRLKHPLNIYKDHVSAVVDIDYSPTGKEIVTGSWDKTVRIFEVDKVRSTKSMLSFFLDKFVVADLNELFVAGSLARRVSYKENATANMCHVDIG